VRPARLETQFGASYRPPHDERRRPCASVVTRLGGGAAPLKTRGAERGESGCPITRRSLPDCGSRSVARGAGRARVQSDLDELGPVARVRRLAHPLPFGRVAQVTVIAVALIVMGFYVLFGRSLRSPKIRPAPVLDNPTQFGEHLLRFNGSQWECARCGALRQRPGQFEIVKCVAAAADITTTA